VSGPISNDAPSGASLLDAGSEPEAITLQFENARSVQALYAGDPALLKSLEEALKVRVTTREGWLKIEGPSKAVAEARSVFEQLDRARQQGVPIRRFEFNYALKSVTEPNGDRRGLGSL
jgi:phosphate starvation-inducible PhoH-like protein